MQAMILAAGFGTRLRPYTNLRPKPLFPVLNTPLLIGAVRRLKNFGFSRIVVNCHHLGEQIVTAVEDIDGVTIQYEERILGTGGGLRRALEDLDDEPLLVVNGDIYHCIDLAEIYHYHINSGQAITMAVHDYPRFNKLSVKAERIVDFDGVVAGDERLAFTGIQVVNPDLLMGIKKEKASCIIEYYRKLLAQEIALNARRYGRCSWTDMGTPADYLNLHGDLLSEKEPCWPELGSVAERNYIDARAECTEDLVIEDWACIGNARIGQQVKLCRCVVWDGAVVEPGMALTDEIVVPRH
ncbi:MAG: NTP transferase domain-containing protein [Desulfofustis sp.]|nr:NTP transferase domain-containing protein [Desulfofustis sp.]